MDPMDVERRTEAHQRRVESLLEAMLGELRKLAAPVTEGCPKCGSDEIENESTMGEPRLRCVPCGHFWKPEEGE